MSRPRSVVFDGKLVYFDRTEGFSQPQEEDSFASHHHHISGKEQKYKNKRVSSMNASKTKGTSGSGSRNIRLEEDPIAGGSGRRQQRQQQQVHISSGTDSDATDIADEFYSGPDVSTDSDQDMADTSGKPMPSDLKPKVSIGLNQEPRVLPKDGLTPKQALKSKQPESLKPEARIIRDFIEHGVDYHILRFDAQDRVYLLDRPLTGTKASKLLNSMVSSSDYINNETEVLQVLRKLFTPRLRNYLTPVKRRSSKTPAPPKVYPPAPTKNSYTPGSAPKPQNVSSSMLEGQVTRPSVHHVRSAQLIKTETSQRAKKSMTAGRVTLPTKEVTKKDTSSAKIKTLKQDSEYPWHYLL